MLGRTAYTSVNLTDQLFWNKGWDTVTVSNGAAYVKVDFRQTFNIRYRDLDNTETMGEKECQQVFWTTAMALSRLRAGSWKRRIGRGSSRISSPTITGRGRRNWIRERAW